MFVRWLTLSVVVLGGCASSAPVPSSDGDGLFFPRHGSPLSVGDAALLEGELAFADGCLVVHAADGTRFLPLWPSDTEPGVINAQPVVLGPGSELLAETGINIRVGGGRVADRAAAEELVGAIPEQCAADAFWGVSTVDTRP